MCWGVGGVRGTLVTLCIVECGDGVNINSTFVDQNNETVSLFHGTRFSTIDIAVGDGQEVSVHKQVGLLWYF